MRHCHNDDVPRLEKVDDTEWKAPHQNAPEAVPDFDAKLRPLPNSIEGISDVIEKVLTEVRVRPLVEERGLGHLFLRGRKKTIPDHRSRLRARAIASSPGTDCISPRR